MAKNNNNLTLAEKLKLIDKISDEVNSKAGKVIAGRLSKNKEMLDKLTIKFIPSVCHDFNVATGGGYPRGRCTLISGPEDSGKVLIACKILVLFKLLLCRSMIEIPVEKIRVNCWKL